MTLLNFILENAPVYIVQEAVKGFNVKSIGYKMRRVIESEFPEYKGKPLSFGIALSNAFEEFKAEEIILIDLNREITRIQNNLRNFSKWHPDYRAMCIEHDALVVLNNKLNEPITNFLNFYKKAQKAKGKKLSVVQKKEKYIAKPLPV